MRASWAGLVLLLVASLVQSDSYYDGEYSYEDSYDYGGGFEYPEESHDYPDQDSPHSRDREPDRYPPPGHQTYEDIATAYEINGDQSYAEPAEDGYICSQTCSISDDKDVMYEPGKQYRYQYNGVVISKSRATMAEESQMSIRAYVIITARTQCDLKLQVMNLAVDDVPTHDSQWFRDAVEKYDLHFSYKNGMVGHLCPHEEEEVAATNFKRGILSAIQSKMTNTKKPDVIVYEADVLGECETEYHISQPSDILVNKTKHNCRYNNYLPYIPSERYSRRELSGDLPFRLNKQSCQMHLQDKVWSRIECLEELEMKEFTDFFSEKSSSSSSPDGDSYPLLASVSINTNLVLEAGPDDAPEPFSQDGRRKRRESLRMDLEGAIESADRLEKQNSNVQEEISVVMNYLMASSARDSSLIEKRPHAFTHLVNLISQVEREVEIDEMWGTYSIQQETRQYLLDALVLCESRTCMTLLSRLGHESPEAFPKTRVLAWLAGVHFQTQPHPDSVQHLMELARNNMDVEQQSVMAASSVVHRLCQRDRSSCRSDAQFLFDYVQEKVGDSCGYGQLHEIQQHVKYALRALSNAGILPDQQFPRKCYMNKLLKPEIRIAALQTFRRVSCNELDLDTPWQILEDVDDDVGVRIAAYQSMVRCAAQRPKFFTRVKNLLHKEEVNQVGSYIWTHIRNLADSPDGNTFSREISRLANHHNLRSKFITNAFRTSRNYRVAQFSKLMNIGGSIDSDLIFTPESYIPSHESHKFHLDFLGNSIDAFEIGADLKGLEGYFERLFGKEGYFENEEIKKVLETFRPKRDIKEEKIQELQMMYDESRTLHEMEHSEKSPEAGLFFRVFGNEVFYVDDIMQSNPLQLLNQFMQEFAVPRSFQILKQEFVSPTILGFPMRFRVNATGTITAENRKDFRMNSMTDFSVDGQISASFVTSMDETLMIDGYGSSSGIRRRSTHNVNTDFGGKIVVQDTKVVDIELRVPNDEIVRVSSSVKVSLYENYRQNWNEREYEGPAEKSEFCSQDEFSSLTGIEFCTISERAVLQLESGNILGGDVYNSEFTLTKSDSFDLYKFFYQSQRRGFTVMFDTPGSSTNRKVELQASIRDQRFQGTLTMPGNTYAMEGSYSKTDELTKFDFRYSKDSAPLAEIELSIPLSLESSGKTYKPKFVLNLKDYFEMDMHGMLKIGQDIFNLEGNMKNSLMENPMFVKALWERVSSQHKIEGSMKASNMFASTSGTLFLDGEKTLVQLECEYGTDRFQPNTLTLTFDKTLTYETNHPRHTGYLLLESSFGRTNVELDYDYDAQRARIDTNVTVAGMEVTSHLTAKNELQDYSRDFEVAFSFACPQLDVNYLGQVIYKISDKAFRSELELILGPNFNTKVALGYLFEQNPLHVQGGVHLHFNDFVIQFAHEIDLSHPGMFLLTSSDVVGPAVGFLQAEVFYDRMAPFNATFDVHAEYNDKQFGLKMDTSSNSEWSHFQGTTEVNWFDWNYSLQHELTLEENNKKLSMSCNSGQLELMLQTDQDVHLQFMFQRRESANPDLKFAALKQMDGGSTSYKTYLQSSGEDLFHFTATDHGDNSYSGEAKFLSSKMEVTGQFLQTARDTTRVQAQGMITFPSGETINPRFDFSHTYDGETRELQVSSHYQEEVIEGKFLMSHKDGWFARDHTKVSFTFASPFQGLRKIGMAFETYSDWSEMWFAEAEWQEMKIRGECQLGDVNNFEVKLMYEDGGSCDSVFHLYHRLEGKRYTSGAILGITKAFDPWSVEVITTKEDDSTEGESGDINLIFRWPLQQTPFEAKANYKIIDSSFSLEFEYGSDVKTRLSMSGENETTEDHHKLVGALNFDSPWADPVFFNVQNLQDSGSFNVSLDLRTSWEYVHTVGAELSVTFNSPAETVAHFYLTQQNVQITMEMIHELSDGSLKQVMQGSVNSVILNYDLNASWDEYFVPVESSGHFNINGLFDHNLELSFTQRRENKLFISQMTGAFDFYKFNANYELDYDHPLKWSSTLEISLPEDKSITSRLFLNSKKDLSSFESTFHLSSSWTDGFTANLEVHGIRPVEYSVEATYGDNTIFSGIVRANQTFHWDEADFLIEVSSTFFDDCKFDWQHNFDSDYLLAFEFSYGENFILEGKGHAKYKQGFFNNEYEGFEFGVNLELSEPQLQFKTKVGFDNLFSCEFIFQWYEYILRLKSSIPDNTVFIGLLSYPGDKFYTELLYEKGNSNIPDFSFKFSRNEEDLLRFNGKFLGTYPEFNAEFTVYYFDQSTYIPKNGKMELQGDLSRLKDFAFTGMLKLNSDFEGFESYWANVDVAIEFEDGFHSKFDGQLHVGDWRYETQVEGKLMIATPSEITTEYRSSYVLKYGDQLYDKKELHMEFSAQGKHYEGKFTVSPKMDSPSYSVFLSLDEVELKGYIMPGNEKKYEVSLSFLSENVVRVSALQVDNRGNTFNYVAGNVTWNLRKNKKQFSIKLNSDLAFMNTVKGQLIVIQKKGVAANIKLQVNEKNLSGLLRFVRKGGRNAGKITIKLQNQIYIPFKTNSTIDYAITSNEVKVDLNMDTDTQKEWAKASLKGSLSESYLRFNLPFEYLNDFDLTVSIETEDKYGLNIDVTGSLFCFTFNSSLNRFFNAASLSSKFDWKCSGNPLYEFAINYNYESDHVFEAGTNLRVQNFGNLFRFRVSGRIDPKESEFQIESEIYPSFYHTINLTLRFDHNFSLQLQLKETHTDKTKALFKFFVDDTQKELEVEVLDTKIIYLRVEHNFGPSSAKVDASFAHSVFGDTFNAKLTMNANFSPSSGNAEFHLTTDRYFDHADFTLTYDNTQDFQGHLTLDTSNGNADIKASVEQTGVSKMLKAEMHSSLHSFKNYQVEALYKFPGNDQILHVKSIQDEIEFELDCSKRHKKGLVELNVDFKMPFENLSNFKINYVYPDVETFDPSHEAKVSFTSSNEQYKFSGKFLHESWIKQEIEFMISTPPRTFGKYAISLKYDLNGQTSLHFKSPIGQFGLSGSWNISDSNFALEANIDLSIFSQGEIRLKINVPLKLYQEAELEFIRLNTDFDFSFYFHIDRVYKNGTIAFTVRPSDEATKYHLSYKYKNRLDIEGQWDEWTVGVKVKFTGRQLLVAAGTFDITSEGFRIANGSWDFQYKKRAYSAEIDVNINEKGTIRFSAFLTPQPKGASRPWETIKLKMNFESPFTKTHMFNAECNLRNLRMSLNYQLGSEIFNLDLNANVSDTKASISANGNIPMKYFSTFSVNFDYNFERSFDIDFKAHAEETFIEIVSKTASNGINFQSSFSWSSPFTNPIDISIMWSFEQTPFMLETLWRYGKQEVSIKANMEYSDTSVHFNFSFTGPFQIVRLLQFDIRFDFADSSDKLFTAELKIGEHMLKINSKLHNADHDSQFDVNIEGMIEMLGISGNMNFVFRILDNGHEVEFTGQTMNSELLYTTMYFNSEDIQFSIKYGKADVMLMRLNFDVAEVKFAWHDMYVNMKSDHKMTDSSFDIDFLLETSETDPLSLKASFAARDKYSGNVEVKYGKKEYGINGTLSLESRASGLEFRFESSEEYHSPLIISAMYDLNDFLAGRMRSEEDLAMMSFEWGDKLQLSLRGQSRGKRTKLTLDIITPFREFPEIHMGYQGQLVKKGSNIDLDFNAYFEWSEKVTFGGVLKFKNKKLNINLDITTPYAVLETLSISLKVVSNHLEASGKLNEKEWKATIDYQFTPELSLSLVAQTPIDGFKSFSFDSSANINNNKLTIIASFIRDGNEDFEVTMTAEMWHLDINLRTPWEPLRDASFVTYLRTESEELVYFASAKWTSSAAEFKLTFSPVHMKIIGKVNVNGADIGFTTFEYRVGNGAFDFTSEIQTPFDVLKAFEFSFQLSLEESKFTSRLHPYYDITIEVKNRWQEMDLEGSVKDPHGSKPYHFKVNYFINPQNAVAAGLEVVSDVTWVSLNIDTIQDWNAQVNIYDEMISMKITTEGKEVQVNFTMKLQNFELESINLMATFMYADSQLSGALTLTHNLKHENLIQHELIWQGKTRDSILSMTFNLKSDILIKPLDVEVDLPLTNILKDDGKFEIRIVVDEEEIYSFSYEMMYPRAKSFNHLIKVQTPSWTADFSVSLTRSNFEMSLFYPNEDSKHSIVVSWPRNISLEKLALQMELSSPFLNEGDVNVIFDFTVKQRFYYTLSTSLSYGTRNVDINSEFQFIKKQRKITFDASVTSEWIGNHSAMINIGWARNISGTFVIKTMDQEHTAKLQIVRDEYTAELLINSPWISSNEVRVTGMMNKDMNASNILIETRLEADENDYSLEGKFESTGEDFFKFYFVMKYDTKDVLRLSGLYERNDNLLDLNFDAGSDMLYFATRFKIRYEENEEKRMLTLNFYNSLINYRDFYLSLLSHREWRKEQSIRVQFDNGSFRTSVIFGEDDGEININFTAENTHFKFEIEYDLSDEFEFEMHLQTPYNSLEIFDFECEWSIGQTKEIVFYYQSYEDNIISFKFNLSPDSVTGWSIGAQLTTPFEGYEKFSIQTPHMDLKKAPSFLIEYPGGKVGLDLRNSCKQMSELSHCSFNYALYLPFEKYEIVSIAFNLGRSTNLELRMGKVGLTFNIESTHEPTYYQLDAIIRVNEYKSRGYFRIYDLRDRFRVKAHADFEMHDLSQLKAFDMETRYDPMERIMFEVKTDQEDLLKLLWAWGTDKIVAITTPKRYPGYMMLKLESSGLLDDYQIEVGLSERGEEILWEKYGFHVQQKQLGYGRDLLMSGKAGQNQFAVEGSVTINPMYKDNFYLRQGFSVEINQRMVGLMTDIHTDFGFFEDLYSSDFKVILPEQTLHSSTNVSCSSKSFDLFSRFKWNDYDSEEEPITFTIDYNDFSLDSSKYTLEAVFSHPEIQNLTLQGNLTFKEDATLLATAEFVDENDRQRDIHFEMSSILDLQDERNIIVANLTQPSSNFALKFDADIEKSIFNRATYQINYWSQFLQQWEGMNITTETEAVNNGWMFAADVEKLDSNWGHKYNGSLLHHDNAFIFNIMGTSELFMDYWKFESSIDKIMPELDMQLHIGQANEDTHEIGRVRAGLHNPLEVGLIFDHERFGVWRQDARAGLRLRSRDLLQFVMEYDPSYDFTSKDLIYSLTSPANKIASAWKRDFTRVVSSFQSWTSSEIPEVFRVVLAQSTFQSILNYGRIKYQYFMYAATSTLSDFYADMETTYHHNVKPFIEYSYEQVIGMYASVDYFLESYVFSSINWYDFMEFLDIQYVRLHDQLIADMDRLTTWWRETSYIIEIESQNLMYQMVRGINVFSEVASRSFQKLQETFTSTFEHYRMPFERYGQELEAVFGGQCLTKIRQLMQDVKSFFVEVKYMGERFIEPQDYVHHMQDFRNWFVQWHTSSRYVFEAGLSQLQGAIRSSSLFEGLMNEYRHAEEFAATIYRDGFYQTFQDRFSNMGVQIMARTDEVFGVLRDKYYKFQQYSRGNIVFDYFDALSGNLLDRLILVWEDWRANEQQVLETFQRFFVAATDTLKQIFQEGASMTEESVIVEPKTRGKIVYNQYLPVPWNSFLEGPQWFRLVNVFQKDSPLIESRRKLNEGIDKIYSQFEALFIPGSKLPPFTATATVYGQQITTFDLFHYQFLGSCSYLMTKDFVGGDFEVIGDYSRSEDGEIRLESMTIRAKGADVILHVDGTHEVKNLGSAEIYAEGNYVAFKQGALFVTCNKISQGCTVTVGSKYFGRLGGLFGNYNYEPSDDSRGPSGRKAEGGNDIGNNWAVSSEPCYQGNQVKAINRLSDIGDYGICHELFLKAASPFSGCFIRVDPRPYFWHCVRDQNRPDFGNKQRNSPCDSAAAYRTQCASQGVHMLAIYQCPRGTDLREKPIQVRDKPVSKPVQDPSAMCEISEGETVPEGWTNTFESTTQGSADVAFVVEVANCNKGRNLELLLRIIKVTLKRSGIQDVRYALVTYQGDDIFVPTNMETDEEVRTQLVDLVLQGPKVDNGGSDAVKEAARKLRWRPGVSRNIIHLACRGCDDGTAVGDALMENDVNYHIITKFKTVMTGPNAKKSKAMANKVYGFDTKRVYTPKDVKQLKGNVNLRKLFQMPEDSSCFEAAQNSGGSVFNMNKWTSKSAYADKKYLSIIGQRLVETSQAPECQECRCLRQRENPKMSCRTCGSRWPAVQVAQTPLKVDVHEGENTQEVGDTGEDGKNEVLQDIRRDFKQLFIQENAAIAQLEMDQEEVGSDVQDRTYHGEEQDVKEEEEDDDEESEESEEDYEYGFDYYSYSDDYK